MNSIQSVERSRVGVYKPEGTCPKDRALVVVQDQRCLVLDHIGPALDYLEDLGTLDTSLDKDLSTLVQGVYIWRGKLIKSSTGEELRGQWRMATKEEWICHINGDFPWDPNLWLASSNAIADEPNDLLDEVNPMDDTPSYSVPIPQKPVEIIKASLTPTKQPIFRIINWRKSTSIDKDLSKEGLMDGQIIDVDAKTIAQLALKYDLLICSQGDDTLIYLDKKEGHFRKSLTPRTYKPKVPKGSVELPLKS